MKKIALCGLALVILLAAAGELSATGLHEDVETDGYKLPEDTRVTVAGRELLLKGGTFADFYSRDGVRSGNLYNGTLAADAVCAAGEKEITVPAENVVWFYESGRLKHTTAIAEPTAFRVQGKDVLFGAEYNIYVPMGFHENGHVKSGYPIEETQFQFRGKPVTFRGTVNFTEKGEITYGQPTEDITMTVQGETVIARDGGSISLYENGEIKEISFLEKDITLKVGGQDVLFSSYETSQPALAFYPGEKVHFGSLGDVGAFAVQGREVLLEAHTSARFSENGALLSGKLARDTSFVVQANDVMFSSEKTFYITFFENGSVESGWLVHEAGLTHQGELMTVPARSYVEFDAAGELIKYQKGY